MLVDHEKNALCDGYIVEFIHDAHENYYENIFAEINVCPKLGDAMFNEDDIFSLPSFDMQVYNDNSMPPTYDDYCDNTYAIKSSDYIYKTYPFS